MGVHRVICVCLGIVILSLAISTTDAKGKSKKKCACKQWGQWSGWSPCKTIYKGKRLQFRTLTCTKSYYHKCGRIVKRMSRPCSEKPKGKTKCACKQWGQWAGPWSNCQAGYRGKRLRFRTLTCKKSYYHKCGRIVKRISQPCLEKPKGKKKCACKQWGQWSGWSPCKTIYKGKRLQFRTLTCTKSYYQKCGRIVKRMSRPCSEKPKGKWSAWGPWSRCSKMCGGGVRQRRRACLGKNCPGKSTMTQPCNKQPCQRCRYGHKKIDRCQNVCTCRRGRYICVSAVRVRKDFASMTINERMRYIKAVKKVSTDYKHRQKYIALIKLHKEMFGSSIHKQTHFLPWHRWFILQFENLLREVDCTVTVPYWDWSLFSNKPWDATIQNSVWHHQHGLGGNGGPGDQCVTTGPFGREVWKMTSAAGNGCLRRRFNGKLPDRVAVNLVLRKKKFNEFEVGLRVTLHDMVHCLFGGVMCEISSAEAPEFFLHHGFVDKLWNDWQNIGSMSVRAQKNKFFLKYGAMPGTKGVRPRHCLYLNRQPGSVSVRYEEPSHHRAKLEIAALKRMSITSLQHVARPGFTFFNPGGKDSTLSVKISRSVIKLFGLSAEERSLSLRIQNWIKPDFPVTYAQYESFTEFEKVQGFGFISDPRKFVSGYCPCKKNDDKKKREEAAEEEKREEAASVAVKREFEMESPDNDSPMKR